MVTASSFARVPAATKGVCLVVLGDSDHPEMHRLIASVMRQDDILDEFYVPEHWQGQIPQCDLRTVAYDDRLFKTDITAFFDLISAETVIFLSPTSVLEDDALEELLDAKRNVPCARMACFVVEKEKSYVQYDPWVSYSGLGASLESLKEVACQSKCMNAHEFLLHYGSRYANTCETCLLSVYYDTDPLYYKITEGLSDSSLMCLTGHLRTETRYEYAQLLAGPAADCDAGRLIETITNVIENKLTACLILERYISEWDKRVLAKNDRKAFVAIQEVLHTIEDVFCMRDEYCLLTGITEPEFCLFKRCNIDEYRWLSTRQNDAAASIWDTEDIEHRTVQAQEKNLRNKYEKTKRLYGKILNSYSYRLGHALLVGPYQVVKALRKYRRAKELRENS